jgi:hypothetical protein
MPQYLPIQLVPARNESQQAPNMFPPYGQFPSTYPYNTLNPQFFDQPNLQPNIQPNVSAQPATVNPSAGIYAPIPFAGQSLHPGMQNVMTYTSNGPQYASHDPANNHASVKIVSGPRSREGVYMDDTRNVKRPKIEPKRIILKDFTDFSNSNRTQGDCSQTTSKKGCLIPFVTDDRNQ